MNAVITSFDPATIVTITLIVGLMIAILAIVGLVWAVVADRAFRDEPVRRALVKWIKSRLRGKS